MSKPQTWDLLEAALGEITYTRDEPPGNRFRLNRAADYLDEYAYCKDMVSV